MSIALHTDAHHSDVRSQSAAADLLSLTLPTPPGDLGAEHLPTSNPFPYLVFHEYRPETTMQRFASDSAEFPGGVDRCQDVFGSSLDEGELADIGDAAAKEVRTSGEITEIPVVDSV